MLDIITVVFRDELPLLKIQAESINQYINPQDINEITIIVNDSDDVAELVDPSWWKQHQSKVKIKCRSSWKYEPINIGWENQQLLKLLAAAESNVAWSIILDAKTWFIKELKSKQLFGINGLPYTASIPGKPGVFVEGRKFVEEHYQIALPKIIGPNGVPFVFHTATVNDMIAEFNNFIEFFSNNVKGPNFITEFFLYSGYVTKRFGSLETLYNTNQCYLAPINIADYEIDEFDIKFNAIRTNPRIATASVHRRAYSKLTQEQQLTWVKFLEEKHLVPDEKEALDLINTYIK